MIGKFEPVINAQILSAFVSAIITCLVAFNVPITQDQRNALLALAGVIIAIFFGGGVIARSNVTPNAKVERLINEAKIEGAQNLAAHLGGAPPAPMPANMMSPQDAARIMQSGGL
jgi:hypothetical protein